MKRSKNEASIYIQQLQAMAHNTKDPQTTDGSQLENPQCRVQSKTIAMQDACARAGTSRADATSRQYEALRRTVECRAPQLPQATKLQTCFLNSP